MSHTFINQESIQKLIAQFATSGSSPATIMAAAQKATAIAGAGILNVSNTKGSSVKIGQVPPTPIPEIEEPKIAQLTSTQLASVVVALSSTANQQSLQSLVQRSQAITNQQITANNLQAQKMQDSVNEIAKSSHSGMMGKIFGWCAIAVGIVVSCLMLGAAVASGGSLLLPALMLIFSLGMAIDSATGNHVTQFVTNCFDQADKAILKGVNAACEKAFGKGLSDKTIGMIAQVLAEIQTFAVMLLPLVIACISNPAEAAEEAGKVIKGAEKLAKLFKDGAQALSGVEGAFKVAEGSSQAATSYYSYQADMQNIASKQWSLVIDALESSQKQGEKVIDSILHAFKQAMEDISMILASVGQSNTAIASNISKAV